MDRLIRARAHRRSAKIAYLRELNRHHAEIHDNSVFALNAHLSRPERLEEILRELAELSWSLKAGVAVRGFTFR